MEIETKQIVVRHMPIDLWRQLKIRAIAEDRTLYDALARAIEQYVKTA